MEVCKRIYNVEVREYIGNIFSDDIATVNNIITTGYGFYTEEEALEFGKEVLLELCCEELSENTRVNSIPDKVFISFFVDKLSKENKSYEICIIVIGSERKRFITATELMVYFKTQVSKKWDGEELYDFLLSLVESVEKCYNYYGTFSHYNINPQYPRIGKDYEYVIDFNEDSCMTGDYTFEYKI